MNRVPAQVVLNVIEAGGLKLVVEFLIKSSIDMPSMREAGTVFFRAGSCMIANPLRWLMSGRARNGLRTAMARALAPFQAECSSRAAGPSLGVFNLMA